MKKILFKDLCTNDELDDELDVSDFTKKLAKKSFQFQIDNDTSYEEFMLNFILTTSSATTRPRLSIEKMILLLKHILKREDLEEVLELRYEEILKCFDDDLTSNN